MGEIEFLLRAGYAGNQTMLRVLHLLSGLSLNEAAEFCRVSPETFRRWRTDRPANPMACRLLAIRAGWMPWPEWNGWRICNGLLMPPSWSGRGLSPGECAALPYLQQLAAELQTGARSAPAAAGSRA